MESLSSERELGQNTDKIGFSDTISRDYLIVALCFLILSYFITKIYLKGKNKKPKKCDTEITGLEVIRGPKPLPISYIGNLYHFRPLSETLRKTVAWHKMYGSCIKVSAVNQQYILVFSAQLAQAFLKSGDFGHISKTNAIFYDVMRPFLGNGVLIAEGASWQARRKVLMKTMTFQCLRNYTKILNKQSRRLVDTFGKLFADGEEHQINDAINSSFLGIITEILTGKDLFGTVEGDNYHHNFKKWKECMITRLEQPWLLIETLWRLHPSKKVHDKAIASMFEFARRRMSEHKLEKEQATQNTSEKEENFQTILDELVDAGANDEDIVHELNTLLFGGHETTAATMHMFFFLMSLHPQHQNQCRKEIDQVFDDPSKFSNGNLFYESLTSLKYVERCLLETLRLLPVAVAYMRRLQAKLRIEYEGKEVDVPPGTSIIIVPWVIHRNEEYYPNPEEFNPDRFLPEENAKRHSHSFLTFSAGPRNCIGIKFGMNEMKTVAAYVLRNFILSTTDKLEDVPLLPYMTLTPQRDYNFRIKKRVYIATKSRDYLTK